MKLYYDSKGINSEIIPSINNTLVKLQNALDVANSIVAPSDVAVSSILSDTKKQLVDNISELNKIKEWLKRSERVIKNRVEDITSDLKQIEFAKINEREQWIKEI